MTSAMTITPNTTATIIVTVFAEMNPGVSARE